MQEKPVVRIIYSDGLDLKGWECSLAAGCGSGWWVWRRWVVQRMKHWPRAQVLWLCLVTASLGWLWLNLFRA